MIENDLKIDDASSVERSIVKKLDKRLRNSILGRKAFDGRKSLLFVGYLRHTNRYGASNAQWRPLC